jgi:hypothetical protein
LFQDVRRLQNADELEDYADYLNSEMKTLIKRYRCKTSHLFLDTLTPVAFVLGNIALFPGRVQLYEYIDSEIMYEKSLMRRMG